jgi:hypothetical protein
MHRKRNSQEEVSMAKVAKKIVKKTATKTAKKTVKKTRPAGQRDLIRHGSRSAYAKRTPDGQFIELDDVGRSQKADRRVKATKTAKVGFGDQGDQRPRRTVKKR